MVKVDTIFIKVILASSVLLLPLHSVHAAPLTLNSQKSTPPKPLISKVPYNLALTYPTRISYLPPNALYAMLRLTNSTKYDLALRWTGSEQISFKIEYKPAESDPNQQLGWKQMMPQSSPQPNNTSQDTDVTAVSGSVQRIYVMSGKEENFPPIMPNLPMSNLGFYRVVAVLTVPEASEYNGAVSPSTKIRNFSLVVRSNSIIVQRTPKGFVEVPPTAGKQPSAK